MSVVLISQHTIQETYQPHEREPVLPACVLRKESLGRKVRNNPDGRDECERVRRRRSENGGRRRHGGGWLGTR